MNEFDIVLRPIITEKSTFLKENGNQYVFEVQRDANKIEIKKAIEKLFKVKVLSVQISVVEGRKNVLVDFLERDRIGKRRLLSSVQKIK